MKSQNISVLIPIFFANHLGPVTALALRSASLKETGRAKRGRVWSVNTNENINDNQHSGLESAAGDELLGNVAIKRLDKELPLPQRAHRGDAGADLYAAESVTLQPGERALVGTGIAIALPLGTVGLIHPRSGLAAKHGLSVVNTPGTVDADYRGEIKVCLINHDRQEPIEISRGMRIAQLVIQRVELVDFVEVEELDSTVRGDGGYGSTGV